MKKMTTLMMICIAVLTIGGCSNTFDGVGKDLKNSGDWIQRNV